MIRKCYFILSLRKYFKLFFSLILPLRNGAYRAAHQEDSSTSLLYSIHPSLPYISTSAHKLYINIRLCLIKRNGAVVGWWRQNQQQQGLHGKMLKCVLFYLILCSHIIFLSFSPQKERILLWNCLRTSFLNERHVPFVFNKLYLIICSHGFKKLEEENRKLKCLSGYAFHSKTKCSKKKQYHKTRCLSFFPLYTSIFDVWQRIEIDIDTIQSYKYISRSQFNFFCLMLFSYQRNPTDCLCLADWVNTVFGYTRPAIWMWLNVHSIQNKRRPEWK